MSFTTSSITSYTVNKHTHGVLKAVNRGNREIEFVASRQAVDRDGEVILTRGIDTANYRRNPTFLLQHDRAVRFGRTDSLTFQTVDGADALVGRATVLPARVSAEVDQAYAELLHGALAGVSIGFRVKEADAVPILPAQTGLTYRETELLEISLVTLPSCQSCVVMAKSARTHSRTADDIIDVDLDMVHRTIAELFGETLRGAIREQAGPLIEREIRRAQGLVD